MRHAYAIPDTPETRSALVDVRRRRWTRDEYHRAHEAGVFEPDERLELIGGEVVEMSPQPTPHATAVTLAAEVLRRAFSRGHHVRVQVPLGIGDFSEPEPDVSIVAGDIRDYEQEHPATAALVVEVADSSLRTDRIAKAGLYASAGVPDYWVVNLVERVVEVRRQPIPAADAPFGHAYAAVTRHGDDAVLSPLAVPAARIPVADLLPRRRS